MTATITAKIQELEMKKSELIQKRKEQIIKIIDKSKALAIDDNMLASALFFLNHADNQNSPILSEIQKFAKDKGFKPPSRAR